MKLPSTKQLFLITFLACAGLLLAAYYFEYVMFLDPCPLCIMQRIAVLMIGLIALSGYFFVTTELQQRIHAGGLFIVSWFGIGVAGRHVWIQSLPADQVPTCGPSLEYMVETLPWADVISIMLRGNGNCAEALWSFMGISMPQWVLIWFVGFLASSIYVFMTAKNNR